MYLVPARYPLLGVSEIPRLRGDHTTIIFFLFTVFVLFVVVYFTTSWLIISQFRSNMILEETEMVKKIYQILPNIYQSFTL